MKMKAIALLLATVLLASAPAARAAAEPLHLTPPVQVQGLAQAKAPTAKTIAHLKRIRPAAIVMWGVTAAFAASVLGLGLGALSLSDQFSHHAYVGAVPPPTLVVEGDRVFHVALSTDIMGIFAITAAVGAIILTVTGYGRPAQAALAF